MFDQFRNKGSPMSIKHKIKIKQQPEENTDEIEDVVRYEEQDEKEYKKQLKKFFKGEDEDNT
jgi:hypothetical protein